MDIFTKLSETNDYSMRELQGIVTAWVLSGAFEGGAKVSSNDGHVEEQDYTKQSVYSLLYALYRSVGTVKSELGIPFEFTFNTWGYDWPKGWGPRPVPEDEPQRFGRYAYTGLYHFKPIQDLAAARNGRVHIVEMGCGTGAGADHVCTSVLPQCTYEAVDMQLAGVRTCRRKFVPKHRGRLVATHADATKLQIEDGVADIVAVCETHVTDQGEVMTEEDRKFFRTAKRILKPGGFFTWGNAIPDKAWQPSFDFMESIGLKIVEVCDVNEEAVLARHLDQARIATYCDQALAKFGALRIPVLGPRRYKEAEIAMKNFARDPGTRLYEDMRTRADTYKVVLAQKV
ncbi:MAG: class I SAM-dependent methyltransferase [Gemmatimonadaceae bacterium]|nr:class I SAM-dependent methyltransferase [Gemmatimonadaceae bacterium]